MDMGCDASYVRDLVGEVLGEGLAKMIIEQPEDPLDYLGKWLLRYVATRVESKRIRREYNDQREQEKIKKERNDAEKRKRETLLQEKEASLEALKAAVDEGDVDVYELWRKAVETVEQWTKIDAVYIAAVFRDPLSNEMETPEEATDGEQEIQLFQEGDVDGGEEVEEESLETVEDTVEDEDRHATYLEFVTANGGQQFLLHTTLHRPVAVDEQEVPVVPPVFGVVDEGSPLYIRCCSSKKEMQFLAGYPKIGSAFMIPLTFVGDSPPSAVLICDTLSPPGTGEPISQEDRALVSDIATTISTLMSQVSPQHLSTDREKRNWLREIHKRIKEIQNPTAEESTDISPASGEQTESSSETVQKQSETETLKTDVDLPEEAHELREEVSIAEQHFKERVAALDIEEQILLAIKAAIKLEEGRYLTYLRRAIELPATELHLIKVTLQLLGKHDGASCSWSSLRGIALTSLLQKLEEFHAERVLDDERWTVVKSGLRHKTGPSLKSQSLLEAALTLFLRQVIIHSPKEHIPFSQACRVAEISRNKSKAERLLTQKQTELQTKLEQLTQQSEDEAPQETAEAVEAVKAVETVKGESSDV